MPGAEYLEAIILGVVQGIAEFLPISSSGHLVILREPLGRLLGVQTTDLDKNLQLNVALHLGTLFSILAIYRAELRKLTRQPRLCLAIVVATIPIVIVGFTLKDRFEVVFGDPLVAGCGLLLTAGLLVVGQKMGRGDRSLEGMPMRQALVIGLFQAVAIVPGISRSGSTIAGGLLTGLRRDSAAMFSFFIAIPAISGAAVLIGKDIWQGQGGGNALPVLAVGALTSFVVGFFSLRWLLRLISQRKLHWFACYCALVAVVTILWQLSERLASS